MIYVDFRKECLEKIIEKYKSDGWKIKLFLEGESASDKADLGFITDTNLKYFGNDRETIGGDFIRLTKKIEKGNSSICRFEVKYLFDEYKKSDWERVFEIVDTNIDTIDRASIPIRSMGEYSNINNQLIVRLLNYEKNKKDLEDKVYRKFGDLAIALYLRLFEEQNMLSSVKVPKKSLDEWNISEDEAFEKAFENSSILYPASFFLTACVGMSEFALGISKKPFDIDKDKVGEKEEIECFCPQCPNGATALFYPNMLEKISNAVGKEDYYVVLTAISEFHVHKCSDWDLNQLKSVLQDINNNFPDTMLSDKIYRYFTEEGELREVE